MADQDYYAVLGVARDASEEDIRRAFRRKAMEYHPDRNKNADAEDKFKEINEAYQVLSDCQEAGAVRPLRKGGRGRGSAGRGQPLRRLRRVRRLRRHLRFLLRRRIGPRRAAAPARRRHSAASDPQLRGIGLRGRERSGNQPSGVLPELFRRWQRAWHLGGHLRNLPGPGAGAPLPAQRFRPVHPSSRMPRLPRARQCHQHSVRQVSGGRARAAQAQD